MRAARALKRSLLCAVVGILVFGMFAGVSTVSAKPRYVLGFSQVVMNCPYYLALYQGAMDTAAKLNVEVIWLNADNIVARQISDIEDLVTRKVDGLLVNPVTPTALESAINKVLAAKIPIVTVDRELAKGHTAYVGIDQWKAGELAGDFIGKTLGGKGKVIEIAGDPGDSAGKGRGGGFRKVLSEKYPGIKIVGPWIAHYNTAEGMARMEEALAANPDVKLVYCHNDAMALGAMKTLKAAGRTDVLIVGIDGQRQAYEEIKKGGPYLATVINNSYEIASRAVEIMVDILDGKKVPEKTITGTILVTKENVDKYYDPDSVF
ncbi:MAG: substrate-binding domain-containing protein [Firmicutes bacterium]|jgi:ribose transport system substrate-binding protein|nr:substrate-binding domain-containing protein [Bacillota bacterium]